MKQLLLTSLLTGLALFPLHSKAQLTGTLTNGLVGYWPLNGNLNDESPFSNNGSVSGNTDFTNGLFGEAFSFDQQTRIVVGDSPSLDPANITLSGWFNATTWNGNNRLINKGDLQYQLLAQYGEFGFELNTVTGADFAVYTNFPSVGFWHNAAATYDGGSMKLYLDGQLAAVTNVNGAIISSNFSGNPNLNFNIGAKSDSSFSTDFFEGLIQNVCVYNRALSSEEISNLFEIQSFGLGIVTLPTVTISGLTNQVYEIQYVTNLSSTNWTTLVSNIVINSSPYLFTDTNALGQPARFYRVVVAQ